MARKGLLSGLVDDETEFTAVNPPSEQVPPRTGRGAFGMMSRAADEMATKVEAAEEIERKLLKGETVIELDPDALEGSFVSDRIDDERFEELVDAIQQRGQDSPILVRPHPTESGRYQIVFGHRRTRAAKVLGRSVRAVVKSLTDKEHVVAQGQENTARADLSFIERALFAAKLSEMKFDNETVMSALSCNKTVISKMASVTSVVPTEIIASIGSAKGIGRDRWYDLSLKLRVEGNAQLALSLMSEPNYRTLDSSARFNLLLAALPEAINVTKESERIQSPKTVWNAPDQSIAASYKHKGKKFVLDITADDAGEFGQFLATHLDRLFTEYKKAKH